MIQIQDAGALRTIVSARIMHAGALKTVRSIKAMHGGTLRSVGTFGAAFSVSAADVSGTQSGERPRRVISSPTQATPIGGLAPYTYSWAILEGGAIVTSPNSASTTFYQFLSPGTAESSTALVTCTDALGGTAITDITVSLDHDGGF